MAPTTVRVERDVKEDLDRLQGLLQAETGERLTHSQLLARLLRVARRHEAELYGDEEDEWRPPAPEQVRALLDRAVVTDVETDVRRLDEELYGDRP